MSAPLVRRRLPPPEVVLVAAVVAASFGLWSAEDGGFAETVWYPVGIVLLLLLGVLAWATRQRPFGRLTTIAAAAFAGLTGWSFLSILWAGDRGAALSGANRTLVFLLVLLVVARQRWQPREAAGLLLVWAVTVTAVGAVDLANVALGSGGGSAFVDGRLSVPIDYANANAALFVLAALPSLLVAQTSTAPAALRAFCLGAAGVAAELAILAQSKGGAIATAATIVLLLLVARRRTRVAVPLAAVAAVAAILHGPLLGVYTRLNDGENAHAAIRSAAIAIAISFACLVAIGALVVLVERRVFARSPRLTTIGTRAAGALGAAALVLAVAIAIVELGSPVTIARHAWHAFKYPPRTSTASSHFASAAGNHRYDFWRVAAHQFAGSPLLGRGVDNFAADYVRLRRSTEQPTFPHSLEARLLGGTGLIGFLLFAAFAAAAVLLCLRAARAGGTWALVGLAGATMFAYWLVHGSVDWLWEFPALSGPAVAAVGCCAGIEGIETPPRTSRRVRRLASAACVAAGCAAAVALVPAWLAARDVSQAIGVWRTDPGSSFAALRQAARLNPLSDQPDVTAGTIAERRRDWPAVRSYFSAAVKRNPGNWYSQLERGIADAKLGQRAESLASLRRAAQLDPLEPTVRDALAAVRRGGPVPVDAIDATLVTEGNVGGR
ncbi:MAG TPA: tetratricopeptide repeat protein [Gaiellaceae bacterium]|nr:tetratricopeptide repeat protein [Gaiellaceae bacterium]